MEMESDLETTKERPVGLRARRATDSQSYNPLSRFRKQQVEWILQAADYDLVTAALVLDTTVGELRKVMRALGISGSNGVHKQDTIR
jgi:hypothetical protein